jgi:hypothetical protein
MTEVLYAPGKEKIATTNAWAFLHWLRGVRNVDLAGWEALQRWSADDPAGFVAAIADFAHLDAPSLRLCRHAGPQEALVWRNETARVSLTRDDWATSVSALPPDMVAALKRDWPVQTLIRPVAELLLHTDLRPDDRLLVADGNWPWFAALLEGTTLIFAAPEDLLQAAEEENATVLVAKPHLLANAAFRRARRRPGLSHLRTVIAAGGPLSPDARRRIYTWLKADVMLLARAGERFWGSPLDPVLAQPSATPAFVTRSAAAPVTG